MRIDSSSARPLASTSGPSATTWSPGASADEVAHDHLLDARPRAARRRGRPSRSARRARRAGRARASRAAPGAIPIAEFATRMPRKSASRQSPNASVSTPKTSRIRLKNVRTFARTMLAVERLVAGGSTARARRGRRCASALVRPSDGAGRSASVTAIQATPARPRGQAVPRVLHAGFICDSRWPSARQSQGRPHVPPGVLCGGGRFRPAVSSASMSGRLVGGGVREARSPLPAHARPDAAAPNPPAVQGCARRRSGGIGGFLVRPFGFGPSRKNPNLCDVCVEGGPDGGFEADVGVLFGDVRGFTALSERLPPGEVGELDGTVGTTGSPRRRSSATTRSSTSSSATRSSRSSGAADRRTRRPLRADGRCRPGAAPQRRLRRRRPAVARVGVGVDFGKAYMGNLGGDDVRDWTALGDAVNMAARRQGVCAGWPDRNVGVRLEPRRGPVPAAGGASSSR